LAVADRAAPLVAGNPNVRQVREVLRREITTALHELVETLAQLWNFQNDEDGGEDASQPSV
jgi:hypothetical protein